MKVLYFSADYTTHDRHFLQKISESADEVWYIRLNKDMRYEKRPVPKGVFEVSFRDESQVISTPDSCLNLMSDFESILDMIKPDLVHAGPVQSCGFMTALANFHPFIIVSWGSAILVDANANEMMQWATFYALKHSDMLLCDCDAVKLKIQKILPYADERIVQFPWGVDLNKFSPGKLLHLRERLGWEDSTIILSTRSWEQIYGINTVLDSFRQAYGSDNRLKLILMGTGSLASIVNKYITKNCLKDAVFMPGRVTHDQLPYYLKSSDVYLSCALSDGSSVSLLEAMATGLPAIVTDTPSNREWIEQNKNGSLVSQESAKGFSEAILEYANLTVQERQKIGLINREIIKKRANWIENSDKLLLAYKRLKHQFS